MRGHNISSTSISVSWDQVPAEQENGIITGYTITYHSQTENHNGTVPASPSERQKTISGLKEYVNYNIRLFASTVIGDGPPSSPVLVVRTDRDSKLCPCYKPSFYIIEDFLPTHDAHSNFLLKDTLELTAISLYYFISPNVLRHSMALL